MDWKLLLRDVETRKILYVLYYLCSFSSYYNGFDAQFAFHI